MNKGPHIREDIDGDTPGILQSIIIPALVGPDSHRADRR